MLRQRKSRAGYKGRFHQKDNIQRLFFKALRRKNKHHMKINTYIRIEINSEVSISRDIIVLKGTELVLKSPFLPITDIKKHNCCCRIAVITMS